MIVSNKVSVLLIAGALLTIEIHSALAQASGATTAPPEGIPAEVSSQFGGAGASVAPPQGAPTAPTEGALSGSNYIYDTLRVITKNVSRGCASNDWNCMANLCKQDLGQTAWRGWAGCHAHDNDYICYFECSQSKQTF
jgi:hypothetical protein